MDTYTVSYEYTHGVDKYLVKTHRTVVAEGEDDAQSRFWKETGYDQKFITITSVTRTGVTS
jgi:hypothetical protein